MDEVIFRYTRAQALEDGVLIDVSDLAREAGFRYPVAVTQELWSECVAVTEADVGQDATGRLWDILAVLKYRSASEGQTSILYFEVLIAKAGGPPRPVRLKAHCGPGDDLEPVITLMMPHED